MPILPLDIPLNPCYTSDMKVVRMTIAMTLEQHRMLRILSKSSMKSQAVLIREAIDLLFKTPGGSTK